MTKQIDTCTVVSGIQNGERSACTLLYTQYKDSIFTLAKRIIKDDHIAEQVVQDAFIEIFKSISSYSEKSSLYTWMRTIVIRTAIKALKTLEQEIARWETLSDDQIAYEIEESPSGSADELHKAFIKLSPGYRTVLTLYYLEDLTHKEISEQLSISIGTSKSQVHYAKIKLKELLENGRK